MFSKRAFNQRRKRAKEAAKPLKKKKKAAPTKDIYVNGIAIEFKKKCDFCEAKRAVFHCPSCDNDGDKSGDFLCDKCDLEVHRHVKRRDHIRTQLPDVTVREAIHRILGCFRYLRARRALIARCREEFQRYYDPPAKAYFYSRPRFGETTWTKPLCLKGAELCPYPSFDDYVFRIQGSARSKAARNRLIDLICENYEKIFSREYTRFYYHFNGGSKLVPRVRWEKPHFLFWRDLKPYKNDDVAALMIQCQWFAWRGRCFMQDCVRKQYTVKTDPLTGRLMYTELRTHKRSLKKPPMLGREEFDPHDISLWGIYKLGVWFRRLGYKWIVPELKKFDVDGKLLLAFEWQDYVDLGFTKAHQIKRILLEIEKRAFFRTHRDLPVTLVRRDRLRYHHRIEKATILIQRAYRLRYEAMVRRRNAELARLEAERLRQERLRIEGGMWWSKKIERIAVPDRGKLFGNSTVDSVKGWGSWVGTKWVPADEATRPAGQRYAYRIDTRGVVAARGLHFSNDQNLTDKREHMLTNLFENGVFGKPEDGGGGAGTG